MYIANELLPDIMLSLCKNWESIEYKTPGFILKNAHNGGIKELLILISCPQIIRDVDFKISNCLTKIILLIDAGSLIPTIERVLSTYFFT